MMKEAQAIYVIENDSGHLKIGISATPWARLATLQSATPARLRLAFAADVDGAVAKLERATHLRIGRMRLSGEWFLMPTADAIEAIQLAAEGLGYPLVMRSLDVTPRASAPKVEKSLPVSFRLPVSTKQDLEACAAALDRSLSWVIEKALIEFLQKTAREAKF